MVYFLGHTCAVAHKCFSVTQQERFCVQSPFSSLRNLYTRVFKNTTSLRSISNLVPKITRTHLETMRGKKNLGLRNIDRTAFQMTLDL